MEIVAKFLQVDSFRQFEPQHGAAAGLRPSDAFGHEALEQLKTTLIPNVEFLLKLF
jgi:hypothetical protein